ncbi:M4 family metallopeptidase [Pontibacillus salipaludis]|uniref:M4 family metallopeptidase n=1 Tax=Pontibacillus salipaludis TaxID=1697394 RepID=UPI0031E4EBFE
MKQHWKTVAGAVTLSAGLLIGSGASVNAEADPAWKLKPEANIQMDQSVLEQAPSFISGKLSTQKINSKQDVDKFFKENKDVFKKNPKSQLELKDVKTDELGMTHYVYQPVVHNVPIDQSRVIVHVDQQGEIAAINGEFHPDAPEKIKQQRELNKKEALDAAWSQIDVERSEADVKKKSPEGKSFNNLTEKSELVVLPQDGEYTLAYHVQLQFAEPTPGNWQIWVNAEDGSIEKAMNKVHEATGSGTGVLGDQKSLNTYYANSTYYLYDVTKPMSGVIATYDNNNGGQYSLPGYYVTDSGNTFYSERQKAAVDAHYYAGEVFDYYYDNFNRESYDGNGADIVSSVHFGSNYNNAAWVGNQMIYGDGDGSTFTYLSGADDIVAHELTHAVTDTTAELVYENQSGALNESFSDVFGYFVDNEDWLMGEDVYTPGVTGDALRSMSNPTQYDQPAHMDDYQDLPNTEQGDWGGVHINSGIPNKAAYYTINSIGQSKAEEIYYRALTVYLTPNSTFSDARQALIQSAQDLYGSTTANSVASAWNNVGVY